MDDDLLRMLKDAGCLMVSLGIETADPDLLEIHKEGVSLEEVRNTVVRIQEAGLRAKGLFMMGLPGETEDSIRRTSDFILSLGLDDMNMAKFTPFPGAPLWHTIHGEGTFTEDWRLMNCLNFVFVPKGIASKERLDFLYNAHVKRFYFRSPMAPEIPEAPVAAPEKPAVFSATSAVVSGSQTAVRTGDIIFPAVKRRT